LWWPYLGDRAESVRTGQAGGVRGETELLLKFDRILAEISLVTVGAADELSPARPSLRS
jgi:hypothetical protein